MFQGNKGFIMMLLFGAMTFGWAWETTNRWMTNPNDILGNIMLTVATVFWAYCTWLVIQKWKRGR